MTEESKVTALINIGQSKVVEKVYDDLLSPPAKNVGTALSTIIEIGNTVLWPIKWLNERTRIYFQNNLKKYEERLNQIPEEKISIVPTEISMPILQRFTYVSNDELSNAFVKLLTSASSTDTLSNAHPGFIYIIDRLSPDEARILTYLKKQSSIPRIDIKCRDQPGKTTFHYIVINETGLERVIELNNPDSLTLYLDNLVSLGLIAVQDYYYTDLEDSYKELEEMFQERINSFKEEGVEEKDFKRMISIDKKMYQVTNYGHLFIEACIE